MFHVVGRSRAANILRAASERLVPIEKAAGAVDVFVLIKGRKLPSSTCGVQKMRRQDGLKGRLWSGIPWVSEQRR